jgi:hypothetical protein
MTRLIDMSDQAADDLKSLCRVAVARDGLPVADGPKTMLTAKVPNPVVSGTMPGRGRHMALEVRRDDGFRNRRRLAVTAVILSMLGSVAAWGLIAWWFAGFPPVSLMLFLMMLWFGFVWAISYVLVERPLTSYRCPHCQRLLPRAEDAEPWYRFRCEPCGVEWDLQHRDGDGGE